MKLEKQIFIHLLLGIFSLLSCNAQILSENDKMEIRQAIDATNVAVRKAFAEGDLTTIKMYHHPDVVKTLAYNNIQKGRKEVLDGLKNTLENFELQFTDDKELEKLVITNEMVFMQARFALKLSPKNNDPSFVYKGRTLVIYKRYDESPTGWATIHEIIQPFEEPAN